MMLDADLLRTFSAIADSGSFTAAGNLVGRTQSAVSMQMKRLEDLLGCELIRRNAHGIALTAQGELLLEHARRILKAHHEAMSAFDRDTLEGVVVLGIPDDYAHSLLPQILADFTTRYPRATVDVIGESSNLLAQKLEVGKVDLAFVTSDLGGGTGPVVHRESYHWVTARSGDAHLQTPLPLAVYTDSCAFCCRAFGSLSAAGRDYRVAYKSQSLAGSQAAVRAGLGVGLLPRSALLDGMRVLGEGEGFPRLADCEVHLLRSQKNASPLLDQLEDFLVQRLQARMTPPPAPN